MSKQGGPERHRCAVDAEDRRQDPGPAGRHVTASNRAAGVRLQTPHRDRPALRLHPGERGDPGIPYAWPDAAAVGDDGQHLLGGLGRQRLSLAEEREMTGFKDAGQPHPSSQAGIKPAPGSHAAEVIAGVQLPDLVAVELSRYFPTRLYSPTIVSVTCGRAGTTAVVSLEFLNCVGLLHDATARALAFRFDESFLLFA